MIVTAGTTHQIKKYSTDIGRANSLNALMDWYGVNSLANIPEEAGIQFLKMLENGEIKMCETQHYSL